MNSIQDLPIALRHFDHGVTLNVRATVTKEFRVRLWIAAKLLTLAAWVVRANLNFVKEEREESYPASDGRDVDTL